MAKVLGFDRLVRKLKSRRTKNPAGVARGIKKMAAFFLRESNKIVPVDTGELQESGHLENSGTGSRTEVDIVYDADHAVIVHEDLEAQHAAGTSAKYLEIAIRENKEQGQEILRKEVTK